MQTVAETTAPVQHDATLTAPEPAILVALLALRDRALATRPAEAGRIERGYQIACAGGVRLDEHGIAHVHSQTWDGVWYVLMGKGCLCNDHRTAPGGRCKHRMAACLWSRALTQVAQRTTAPLDTLPATYAFPQWTRYEASYVGPGEPRAGLQGMATRQADGQFWFVPEGETDGFLCGYADVALGRGIDA